MATKTTDTKPAPTKKAAQPSAKKSAGTAKKPNALSTPVQPSVELAAIVGDKPLPRSEVVKKTWEYIKKHKLQNPKDGREILADDKLEIVFGKKKVTMFEMNKLVNNHLKT